jgi:hypothetical protein
MYAVYAVRETPLSGHFAKPGAVAREWYLVGRYPTRETADAECSYQALAFGVYAHVVVA